MRTNTLCSLGLAMVIAAGACGAEAMGSIVISDGTFANSHWTLVARPYGPGGGSGSGQQVLSGGAGDNGAARRTSNQAGNGNSGSYNASIYTAMTYTPSVSGALTGLSIAFDSRYIDGLSAIGAVVEQSGLTWMWGYEINTPGWQRWTFTPTSSDWFLINPSGAQLGAGPDFSSSGGPMRFGYYTANGATNSGYTHSGLTDNFTVSFVPAPSAAALIGIMGLGAIRRRR